MAGYASLPSPSGLENFWGPSSSNNTDWGGIASGAGSIASALGKYFSGDQNNPANAAKPYLDQIPGTIDKYLSPYTGAGQKSIPILQKQYGQLINDPNAMYDKFSSGYQESPGYKFNVDQATKAANQAAAAGGMVGSPAEQQELAKVITGLSSQDFQQFLSHIIGLYTQGLNGEQNFFNTGANAAGNAAQAQTQALNNQANLAYQGANNQNKNDSSFWDDLIKGVTQAAPKIASAIF